MKISLHKPIYDLPSALYHSTKNTFSSTQIKDLLEGERKFHAKHIAKTIPRTESSAFDVGTYFHTAVLEPEKLAEECVIWSKPIRRGAEWDAFQSKHKGKVIVNKKEVAKAKLIIDAVTNSKICMKYLSGGKPEVSLFVKIRVKNGIIYAVKYKLHLTRDGWAAAPKIPEDGVDLVLKVRSDYLGSSFVSDLKSTSGDAECERTMKAAVSRYNYDLSAALYLDMFTAGLNKYYDKFYWIFASKDCFNAKPWLASPKNILIGRAKWSKSILKLAKMIESDWKFVETVGILEPSHFEYEHLT